MAARLPPSLEKLITCLAYLPGVGPKTATRMALNLLERQRERGGELATAISQAMANVRRCKRCNHFSEEELCPICLDTRRDEQVICVVESATDVIAIEQTSSYNGVYFVLKGHLSPLDGIGPEDIGIELLHNQLKERTVKELILAMGATVEGEATAHFIAEIARKYSIRVTRLAQGIPNGGELGMLDSGTLNYAMQGRKAFDDAPV